MTEERRLELAKILIVYNLIDMFLDEVTGLPLVRDVEFAIDFGLVTTLCLSSGSTRSNCRSYWIRVLLIHASHLWVLLSSSSRRRATIYSLYIDHRNAQLDDYGE